MGDPLETELDRLFQVPPGDFVAARNALADTLRRAGDKTAAARVKAIKRATPIAWALNQAHFGDPALFEQAREHTSELRALQTQRGVDTRELARAVEQQRRAVQAVVDAALRAGRGAGLSDAVLQPRKLLTTMQAWLAGKSDEAPGRMTVELEASGFDAFAGVALTTAPPAAVPRVEPPPSAEPIASPDQAAADRAVLEEATRMLKEREQHVLVARERVQVRAAEQAEAQQAHAVAVISVREAERQLGELRAALEQRARSVERCTTALTEARAQAGQAEDAAAAARAELTALEIA